MASHVARCWLWAGPSHTAASTREVQLDVARERVHPRQSALKGSTSNPKMTVFLYAMRRASGDYVTVYVHYFQLRGLQQNMLLDKSAVETWFHLSWSDINPYDHGVGTLLQSHLFPRRGIKFVY